MGFISRYLAHSSLRLVPGYLVRFGRIGELGTGHALGFGAPVSVLDVWPRRPALNLTGLSAFGVLAVFGPKCFGRNVSVSVFWPFGNLAQSHESALTAFLLYLGWEGYSGRLWRNSCPCWLRALRFASRDQAGKPR